MAVAAIPQTKKACLSVLRDLGYRGLKIDAIEDDRVFVLTGQKLMANGQMERQARTIFFTFTDDEVHVSDEPGWLVT